MLKFIRQFSNAAEGEIAAYDLLAGNKFLLFKVFPEAVYLPATIGRAPGRIESGLPKNCRYFFFHYNLTYTRGVMPDQEEFASRLRARGIEVFNAHGHDISKRALHAACCSAGIPCALAPRDGDPDEKLIVKTDLNYAGIKELGLSRGERKRLGISPLSPVIQRLRSAASAQSDKPFPAYPVLRRREIEADVWLDRQVVVERFLENSADEFHRVHFLGEHISVISARCPGEVKKLPWAQWWSHCGYVGTTLSTGARPASLPNGLASAVLALKLELRLDYGAFDVVFNDAGESYFVDVNSTPYWDSSKPNPLLSHLREALQLLPVKKAAAATNCGRRRRS